MVRKLVGFCFLLMVLFAFQVELKAEEIPKPCQIIFSEPDGTNGYYKGAPEARIKHMDEHFITRYQLDCPGGKKIVGRLEGAAKSEEISSEVFVEGRYKLNIWLEDVKGQVIAGTEQTKEIKIDESAPALTMQFKTGNDQGNKGQTTENLVEIKGEDGISGVGGIYYRVGEGAEQYIKGNHAFVSVPPDFQGAVVAYATDNAGNMSSSYECPIKRTEPKRQSTNRTESDEGVKKNSKEQDYIIQKQEATPQLWIEGFENNTIVGKDVRYICRVSEVNWVQGIVGQVVWENENGKKETIELTDWKEEGGQYILCGELSRDGRYAISVEVSDLDGNAYKEKRHVIVDKTNPVIQTLEELNGARLTSFQWKYSLDEVVDEFTTYNYEIRLDGVLCDIDKVYTGQGKHILELLVVDGAGNESRATATFYIVEEKEETPSVLRWIWPSIALFAIGLVGFVWVFKKKGP